MNFYQVMGNVSSFLAKEDVETLKIKDQVTLFNEKYKLFDDAVVPLREQHMTSDLKKIGEQRDQAIVGLAMYLRAYANYMTGEKSDAAKYLRALLLNYGKSFQLRPLREKTAIVINLLQDFDTATAKAKLAQIGADEWVKLLKDSNIAFEALYNRRTLHTASIEKGLTLTMRAAVFEAFKKLVERIEALCVIEGEAAYKHLLDNIQMEIKQAALAERPEMKKKGDKSQPIDNELHDLDEEVSGEDLP